MQPLQLGLNNRRAANCRSLDIEHECDADDSALLNSQHRYYMVTPSSSRCLEQKIHCRRGQKQCAGEPSQPLSRLHAYHAPCVQMGHDWDWRTTARQVKCFPAMFLIARYDRLEMEIWQRHIFSVILVTFGLCGLRPAEMHLCRTCVSWRRHVAKFADLKSRTCRCPWLISNRMDGLSMRSVDQR